MRNYEARATLLFNLDFWIAVFYPHKKQPKQACIKKKRLEVLTVLFPLAVSTSNLNKISYQLFLPTKKKWLILARFFLLVKTAGKKFWEAAVIVVVDYSVCRNSDGTTMKMKAEVTNGWYLYNPLSSWDKTDMSR